LKKGGGKPLEKRGKAELALRAQTAVFLFLFACTLSIHSFFQRSVFQYGPDRNPKLEID
jgi:hypothetical protein